MNWLAQLFGLIASFCMIMSSQRKYKAEILLLLLLGECFFALSFLFLQAYSGFFMSLIGIVITTTSYLYNHYKKKVPIIFIILIIISVIIVGFFYYQEPIDVLPIIGATLYAISSIQAKEQNIRRMSLIIASLWIIYDVKVGAYVAIISDVLYIISSLTAIIRYDSKYH
jgi:drug/metabolite transporter (DMT)-like permease